MLQPSLWRMIAYLKRPIFSPWPSARTFCMSLSRHLPAWYVLPCEDHHHSWGYSFKTEFLYQMGITIKQFTIKNGFFYIPSEVNSIMLGFDWHHGHAAWPLFPSKESYFSCHRLLQFLFPQLFQRRFFNGWLPICSMNATLLQWIVLYIYIYIYCGGF